MLATYLAVGMIGGSGAVTPPPPPPPPPPTGLLATFRARYPAFAAVADDSVEIWLDEGFIETAALPAEVQTRAVMLCAAHQLASQGLGEGTIAAGVTSFRSGSFSATLSDSHASRTGLSATAYGRDYLALMRRYFGGPRLAWTPPAAVW